MLLDWQLSFLRAFGEAVAQGHLLGAGEAGATGMDAV